VLKDLDDKIAYKKLQENKLRFLSSSIENEYEDCLDRKESDYSAFGFYPILLGKINNKEDV